MKETHDMPSGFGEGFSRRKFLKLAVAGTVAAGVVPLGRSDDASGTVPMRILGRTGEKISAIGMGGYHMGVQDTEDESIALVRKAVDNGITFLDNSWDYNGGASEVRMGKALRDGYRAKVFLMTKIDGRTKEAGARQINESLKRLQTDCIDLMQFHEIIRMEDPARIFATGGAIEGAIEARKAGKIRYIGFTGHKDPSVHLKMLDVAAEHQFRFDAVQMPLNVMDAHFRSFAINVVPRLVKEGVGILGMKALGCGAIARSSGVSPIECLHYALNLPTSTVITGIDSMRILDQALEAGRTFRPMTDAQVAALLGRTRDEAATGRFERFKTTTQFDGTERNPQWLG